MLSNIEIFSIQSNLFLHPPTHPPTSTTPPVDLFPQSISSGLYSVFCGFPCPAGSTFFCTIALLDFYTFVLFCVFYTFVLFGVLCSALPMSCWFNSKLRRNSVIIAPATLSPTIMKDISNNKSTRWEKRRQN